MLTVTFVNIRLAERGGVRSGETGGSRATDWIRWAVSVPSTDASVPHESSVKLTLLLPLSSFIFTGIDRARS